jgi:bacteriochlorophyll 4-vinyl reductase
MSEPRIGRVLVASLHQAIADQLPNRLEFYENWLSVSGLRDGTIGLAPLFAVLSFLRTEGAGYQAVTTRAGEYAADWTVNNLTPLERRVMRALPASLRARAALRTARALVRDTYPGSRALVRMRRGTASVDLRGSLFCEVREAAGFPLCGFYAAAFSRVLQLFAIRADACVNACRGAGGGKGCQLSLVVSGANVDDPAAAA